MKERFSGRFLVLFFGGALVATVSYFLYPDQLQVEGKAPLSGREYRLNGDLDRRSTDRGMGDSQQAGSPEDEKEINTKLLEKLKAQLSEDYREELDSSQRRLWLANYFSENGLDGLEALLLKFGVDEVGENGIYDTGNGVDRWIVDDLKT